MKSNKTHDNKLKQYDIYSSLSSIAGFTFVLNSDGVCTYLNIADDIININPATLLNEHYKKINISEGFIKKLEKTIELLRKDSMNQEFEFKLNNDLSEVHYQVFLSELKSNNSEANGCLIIGRNITEFKQKEKELTETIEKQKLKIKELELEADFYIKQGDVITNQRTKIQKDRDKLAIEKSDIAKQKELVEADLDFIIKQGDKIAEQKHKIKIQHDLVRKQNRKIEDSILYAKRIQSAVLPPNRFIQHLLTEHFIFYKPRDIVSGDFYWIKQFDEKIFIAAADCTGHGVPGALMSMLGITFLNEIINKNPDIHANEILNELRIHIISSLRQTGSAGESRDGLDIAICVVNHTNKEIEYAGANNPMYLIRKNELSEIKADRMPIGYHRRAKDSFRNHIIKLKKDDLIYIFTDGYADQFGGKEGRKFLSSNFKNLLIKISSKPLNEQKLVLEKTFDEWKGERRQLDDLLVIGFKISFEKDDIIGTKNYNWTGKTILVAEDDESNYVLLRTALEKTKAEIIRAENGKEAVKLFKENPHIDLILMDIRMPVMDGIEATSQIKDMNNNIPIIVLTAFTMSTEKEKSFKAGCDDYISKPINLKELFATISKYIEK